MCEVGTLLPGVPTLLFLGKACIILSNELRTSFLLQIGVRDRISESLTTISGCNDQSVLLAAR